MRVGLQKTSLIDFPGEVAATVFTRGCNLRCPYCHNPDLVLPEAEGVGLMSLEDLDSFLARRSNVLGGVCVSGGEPLLHENIAGLLSLIRRHGLKVKLDSNGTFPKRLAQLLSAGLVDYVAMDLKTSPELYDSLLTEGKTEGTGQRVVESIEVLRRGGVPYELRTTVVPGIVGVPEIESLTSLLPGARRYVLKPFRGGVTLDPEYSKLPPPSEAEMKELRAIAEGYGVPCL